MMHRSIHHGLAWAGGATVLAALCLSLGCNGGQTVSPDVAPSADEASADTAADTSEQGPSLAVDTEVGPPLLPLGVTSFGATSLGGDTYILGGYFGTPHQYDETGQTGALLRASAGGQRWESLGEIEPLQSVALASVDGRIVRVGGMRILNAPGEDADMRSIAEVGIYDPATNTWTEGPALPEPRSSHEVAAIGSVVYVAGGWTLSGGPRSGTFQTQALALDLSAAEPSWQAFDMPFARRALGVAAAGGKLYAVGGMTDAGKISTSVDIYDPATKTWSKGPDFPGEPFGLAAEGVGEALVASGNDGVVYRLEPGADAWKAAGTLAFPRFFHQLVESPSGLLALGGIHGMSRDARTRQVEQVSLAGSSEAQVRGLWRLDSPGAAKNRMGMVLHDDALYLFGGNRSVGQHDFGPEDFLAEGHRLHLPSMTWSELADLPVHRQTMGAAVVDGTIVAVGGFGHPQWGESARTHGEVYHYDLEAGAWTLSSVGLVGTRSQFGLAVHGEQLWMFGGLDYDPARAGEAAFDHRLDVLVAENAGSAFELSGVELTGPRRAFAGAAHDGRYFMFGGMQGGFEPVTTCEAFTFETKTWSTIACPGAPVLSAQLVAIDDALYLVGGSKMGAKGLEPNLAIQRYDPEADSWSTVLDAIPLPAKHLRAFAFNGRLLLYSAHFADATQAMVALIEV
ncbi:hypothetical protein PPSIR1_16685 [Plesiocystis pacifica SIR-1]|uniref:N-acetylneuraminate epimerase n=1 Tax=Plesiocystis pacifica SIR-1 TaxID=391625 RepID=A6G392_9BACT|nr:kelch repeat-containing protein [Plesiocystis pacifica]EDM79717.1 hypothetical protein PPSIR1_16685 [Plesiocystis pacifica SIR-1]